MRGLMRDLGIEWVVTWGEWMGVMVVLGRRGGGRLLSRREVYKIGIAEPNG